MKIGKEETMWAICNEDIVLSDTLSTLRVLCKKELLDKSVLGWKEHYAKGWRIKKVKVLITEIE